MSPSYPLAGLYVITDARLQAAEKLSASVELALQGGAKLVQYRDKSSDRQLQLSQGKQLVALCHHYNVPLIVNDDPALAQQIKAAGVHLGRGDSRLQAAREQLGDHAIIGISCYNEWERAVAAATGGADYIAFGSFFASPTKPDAVSAPLALLERARQNLPVPVAAIGGITPDKATSLVTAGAQMLAVVHGVFAQQDIKSAAQHYAAVFKTDNQSNHPANSGYNRPFS